MTQECWILDKWQKSATKRITSRCRNKQFGFLLYHQVGSGKTVSLLSILSNFPNNVEKTIFCPKVLTDGYSNESPDVNGVLGNSKKKFLDKLSVKPLSGDDSFESMVIGDMAAFKKLCTNKIVAFDEFHNVISFIRKLPSDKQTRVYNNIREGLLKAKRVIVMTGTPILNNISDITLTLSFLTKDPKMNFPLVDDMFYNKYHEATEEDIKRESALGNIFRNQHLKRSSLGIITGLISSVAITMGPRYNIPAFAAVVTGNFLLDKVYTITNSLENLSLNSGYFGFSSSFNIATYLINQYFYDKSVTIMNDTSSQLENETFSTLNKATFEKDCTKFISFFDYETYKIKEGDISPRNYFPTLERVRDVETSAKIDEVTQIFYPYSEYQCQVWMRMRMNGTNTSIENDRKALGVGEMESVTMNTDTYFKYVSRLSDISTDSLFHEEKKIKELKEAKYKYTSTYKLKEEKEEGRVYFECPKFMEILKIIKHYATSPVHYTYLLNESPKNDYSLVTNDNKKWKILKENDKNDNNNNTERYGVGHCFKVKNNKLVIKNDGKLIQLTKHRWVPVIYPRFERTMKELSAYLTSKGVKHYVVHKKTAETEKLLAKQYELLNHDGNLNEDYVCAILHPDLIEGLNCTFNPALICVDVIEGYGILEQIHGRILRKLKYYKKDNKDLQDDISRFPKRIYQMVPSSVDTNTKLEIGKEMQKMQKLDAKRREKEMQEKKALDANERKKATNDFNKRRIDRVREKSLFLSKHGYKLKFWNNVMLEQTFLRQKHNSPESIILTKNTEQKRTIQTIRDMFGVIDDETLSTEHCGNEEICNTYNGCNTCSDLTENCKIQRQKCSDSELQNIMSPVDGVNNEKN